MCGGCATCLHDQRRSPVSACDSCGAVVDEDSVWGEGVDLCAECMGLREERWKMEEEREDS